MAQLSKRSLFSIMLLGFFFPALAGQFIKTKEGIIVFPDKPFSGNAASVELKVIADNIFQVIAKPTKERGPIKSFMVNYAVNETLSWKVFSNSATVSVSTARLRATINLQTGAITYFDAQGRQLTAEKPGGRKLKAQMFEGKKLFNTSQTFLTSKDDAWYGLGQHQDDIMNYKSYQVYLFQNNTEVAVPFLLSKKNYGILWDNNSLTSFGDVRPYQPLNALQLFSKEGDEGWLTVTYSNDLNKPAESFLVRPESSIDYKYLNDSRLFLPPGFTPATGVVNWEGSIASSWSGQHKLRFTYAGYMKLWINGKLLLDRWRPAWNPGSAIVNVDMINDEKNSIRIEWMPNGGESYISLAVLPPLSEDALNSYTFSSEAGEQLNYYFIQGKNMDDVIAGYRKLTGKAVMLPLWAFGKWQSRERYKTQDEILQTVQEFRKRKIPLDNIVLDWSYWKEAEWGSQEFDPARFSNPESMINLLHEKYNTHFMISVWPKFYEGIKAYKDFNNKGWLYKRNVADRQRDWIAQGYVSTFYDAFNEKAQKGFWDLISKKIYSKGVDAWWMDASEPDILSNVDPEKRKYQMTATDAGPSAQVLNAYPLVNAKGIYEGQRAEDPGKRVFILTRSAFGGLQRYAAATWSGDIASRWHDMKAQIPAGINFSMSGLPYWTMDIGGFAVEGRYEHPNDKDLEEWREQMTRWYQFGAFVPLFRVHGQFPYREIYNVAPEDHPAYKSALYYDRLRYRLLPYIYSLAGKAYLDDYTIMRGLVMDFGKDEAVNNISDQYMFGPSLMINPVYKYQSRDRQVYLPKGTGWYDLYTGKFLNGGQYINADAPYERTPIFVKQGSIIPVGPELQYTTEKPADTIRLFVYTGANASFSIYEDEGTNYNYEKGRFSQIKLDYDEVSGSLTIGNRQGSFEGMLQQRVFEIVCARKDKPLPFNPGANGITVKYDGKRIVVKL